MACGGGNPSASQLNVTSGVAHRAFVSNTLSSRLQIVDAVANTLSTHTISVGISPTFMVESPDRSFTLVFNSADNSLSEVSNSAEQEAKRFGLAGFVENDGIVVTSDSSKGYIAVRNAHLVDVVTLPAVALGLQLSIPAVSHLVISHNSSKVLAFSDGQDRLTVITTSNNAVQTLIPAAGVVDRPVSAVFSADDSVAYILSCGPECGGTTAKVTPLTMSTLTFGTPVAVDAATVGTLVGSSLYVAGNSAAGGFLDILSVSGATVNPPGAGKPISNGYHDRMVTTSDGMIYIGAETPSFGPNSTCPTSQGCLSIVNTSGNSVTVEPADCSTTPLTVPCGAVTGIAEITNQHTVYVIMNGELVIFDGTTNQPLPSTQQIDIVGKVSDVKEIDQ